jgi:hypothetical protein
MVRKSITPGRLYALMNAEFRRTRPKGCTCNMPLPFLVSQDDADRSNWTVGTIPPVCGECREAAGAVAERLSAEYDVYDPMAVPVTALQLRNAGPSPHFW